MVEAQQFTPQEVINLFSALERLEEAEIVQQKVGPELNAKANISMETIALLRVRTIIGGEVSDEEQESLNRAGRLLKNMLVTSVENIPQKNYPEYLIKVFTVIQTLEGINVAQAFDKEIQSHAGVSWSNIALNRVNIIDGDEIPKERLDQITAAGIYLTSVLNNLLAE